MMLGPSSGQRLPTGNARSPEVAIIVAVRSDSKRMTAFTDRPKRRANSSAIASKISAGGAASATSVATRRSAACSSAEAAQVVVSLEVGDGSRDQLREEA